MKKTFKRLLAAVIAMTMLLTAVPVWAAAKTHTSTSVFIKAGKNIFQWTTNGKESKKGTLRTREVQNGCIFLPCEGYKEKKIKSSDKSTLSAAKDIDGFLKVRLKKAGTTAISYTAINLDTNKRENYKNICKVYNYTNPLASFKIGKTDYASTFKKSPFSPLKDGQVAKGKLSVKLNKGWKLVTIRQATEGSTLLASFTNKFKTLKNNSYATTKKGVIEVIVYNRAQKYYTSVILGCAQESNMISG